MSNFVWVNRFNKLFKETDKEKEEREKKEEAEKKKKDEENKNEAAKREEEGEREREEKEKNKKSSAQNMADFMICFFALFIFGVFQFSLFRTYLNIPADATKSPYINRIPYKWAQSDSWFGKFFGGTLINCWRDLRFILQKYFSIGNKIKVALAPQVDEGSNMLNIGKGFMKFWGFIITGLLYFIISIILVFIYLVVPLLQTIRGMFAAADGEDIGIGIIGLIFTFWPIVIFTYFFQIIYVFFYPVKAIFDGTFVKEVTNAFKAENRGGQLYQFFFWLFLFFGILFILIGGNVGFWGAIISFTLLGYLILFMILNFTGLSAKLVKKMTKAKKDVRQENRASNNVNINEKKMQGGGSKTRRWNKKK